MFAQRTVWGQQIYAHGANPVAARLSGVPVERRLLLVYAVSGAMAGLASLIILARINSAQGDIGEELTLPAIAAVLIGGTSLFGGSGTVAGTLIGALILTLVAQRHEPAADQCVVAAARHRASSCCSRCGSTTRTGEHRRTRANLKVSRRLRRNPAT